MSPAILAYVTTALQLLPLLQQAGTSIAGLVVIIRDALHSKADPTAEQWKALDDAMTTALAALDKAAAIKPTP